MQYTEQELAKLIQDVESAFAEHLAKAETAQEDLLVKAEDKKEKKTPKESKEEIKEEVKENPKEESKETPEEEAKEQKEGLETKKPEHAPEHEESGYDDEDMEHMHKMYMSMNKAELIAHHDSVVKALDTMGAEHQHAKPEMAKSEVSSEEKEKLTKSIEEKSVELELAKSEVINQKSKIEELQKNLDTVQEFLTKLVKKVPQGKAVTSLEPIYKNEQVETKELSKSEITNILSKKAADPKLSKSDREAINAYYLNQSNLNTISHLLK